MRHALGIDQDLRAFYERFPVRSADRPRRCAPTRGCASPGGPTRSRRWRGPICEQLIEYERAAAIQRRLVARLGRRCPTSGLRDSPPAAVLAGQAPALLASFDLAPRRALTLVRAAREVASGRVDLTDPDHERGWRRLRAISGIGSWTIQMLALTGQGRLDQLPAGRSGLHEARRPAARRRSARPRHARRRWRASSRPTSPGRGSPGCTRSGAPAAPGRCGSRRDRPSPARGLTGLAGSRARPRCSARAPARRAARWSRRRRSPRDWRSDGGPASTGRTRSTACGPASPTGSAGSAGK